MRAGLGGNEWSPMKRCAVKSDLRELVHVI